jgi:uncharacterized membrane protein YccC
MTIFFGSRAVFLVQGKHVTRTLRWLGRRLELRSFGLIPEHFNRIEGYRAAAAVAPPLALAVLTGNGELGWAVFAAFWTCLCDAPGPDRLRRSLLAIFMVCGAIVAFVASWLASLSPEAGMVCGPLLVFFLILATAPIAYGGIVGTLLAVVAVVAVGFPHSFTDALWQAACFFAGAMWAYLLINVAWRVDPDGPLRGASEAVILRLLDMAEHLVCLREGPHQDEQWHSEHSEHRRAVRLSIERLRSLLARYAGDPGSLRKAQQALVAAEAIFGTLLALDQTYIDRLGSATERLAVALGCRRALLTWRITLRAANPTAVPLNWAADRMRQVRAELEGEVFIGCALALETALADLTRPVIVASDEAGPDVTGGVRFLAIPTAMWQQALRQSAGLIAVYYAATLLRLGYPYWAAMAVIVVLQGGARVTWARCLERIFGSLLGGVIAVILLQFFSGQLSLSVLALVLAAAAISLRAVNYTIFVVFLTVLFVLVTQMLHPGAGIAWARMFDNVIGSVAALLAVFLLWPDFGAPLTSRIADGIDANQRYRETVEAGAPIGEIEIARRAAGLASIEAEIAFHDLGGFLHRLRNHDGDFRALRDMRNLAGRAAIAWHCLLADKAATAVGR